LRWRLLVRILLAEVIAAALLAVYWWCSGAPNALTNALFVVGMPCLLVGLWRIVQSVGFFNIVTYSLKRFRAAMQPARSREPLPPELMSLAEYNLSKGSRPLHHEHLVAGILFILASVVVVFV
jgi:hypothetical protein